MIVVLSLEEVFIKEIWVLDLYTYLRSCKIGITDDGSNMYADFRSPGMDPRDRHRNHRLIWAACQAVVPGPPESLRSGPPKHRNSSRQSHRLDVAEAFISMTRHSGTCATWTMNEDALQDNSLVGLGVKGSLTEFVSDSKAST